MASCSTADVVTTSISTYPSLSDEVMKAEKNALEKAIQPLNR